jgi:hypothetical protein
LAELIARIHDEVKHVPLLVPVLRQYGVRLAFLQPAHEALHQRLDQATKAADYAPLLRIAMGRQRGSRIHVHHRRTVLQDINQPRRPAIKLISRRPGPFGGLPGGLCEKNGLGLLQTFG